MPGWDAWCWFAAALVPLLALRAARPAPQAARSLHATSRLPSLPAPGQLLPAWHYAQLAHDCSQPESLPASPPELSARAHVVYSCDAEQLLGLVGSLLSLLRHLKEQVHFTGHVVMPKADLGPARLALSCLQKELAASDSLRGAAAPVLQLHLLQPQPLDTGSLRAANAHLGRTDFMQATNFVKFYLPCYLPAAPRAIWLDTDMVVRADLGRLASMRLQRPVAAPPEGRLGLASHRNDAAPPIRELFSNLTAESYFNPGLLVADLAAWRREDLLAEVHSWMRATKGFMLDMLALNLAFAGRALILDWRWNVHLLGLVELPKLCAEQAHVLHFNGASKPWQLERRLRPQGNDHLFRPYLPGAHCDVGSFVKEP